MREPRKLYALTADEASTVAGLRAEDEGHEDHLAGLENDGNWEVVDMMEDSIRNDCRGEQAPSSFDPTQEDA